MSDYTVPVPDGYTPPSTIPDPMNPDAQVTVPFGNEQAVRDKFSLANPETGIGPTPAGGGFPTIGTPGASPEMLRQANDITSQLQARITELKQTAGGGRPQLSPKKFDTRVARATEGVAQQQQYDKVTKDISAAADEATALAHQIDAFRAAGQDDQANALIAQQNAAVDRANQLLNTLPSMQDKAYATTDAKLAGADKSFVATFQQKYGLPVTGTYDGPTQTLWRSLSDLALNGPKPTTAQLFGQKSMVTGKVLAGDTTPTTAQLKQLAYYTRNPQKYEQQQIQQAANARAVIRAAVSELVQSRAALVTSAAKRKSGQDIQDQATSSNALTIKSGQLDKVLGIKNEQDRQRAITTLIQASGADDFTAINVAKNLQAGRKQEFGSGDILGSVSQVLETVFGSLQRMYYAGKYSELHGGGVEDILGSMLGGLGAPGNGQNLGSIFGFTTSAQQHAIEATNTEAERALLTKRGELASFGQFVTGKAADVLKGRYRDAYLNEKVIGTGGFGARRDAGSMKELSGAVDVAFQVTSDPTLGLSMGLHGIAEPTKYLADVAAKAAEDAGMKSSRIVVRIALMRFWEETKTGLALRQSISDALDKFALTDSGEVRSIFRGINQDVAQKVAEAATREEKFAAIREAVITGVWHPKINPLKVQFLAGLGFRDTVGGATIRTADRTAWLRDLATPEMAATFTHKATDFGKQAITTALSKGGSALRARGDFEKVLSKAPVLATDVRNIWKSVAESNIAGLQAFAEQRLRPFMETISGTQVTAASAGYGSVASALANNAGKEGFDAALSDVRVVLGILDGKAGKAAAEQMRLELDQGFRAGASTFTLTARTAGKNVGLALPKSMSISRDGVTKLISKLPTDLASRATEELATLTTKKQVGKFATGVVSLLHNDLAREEASRLIHIEDTRLAEQAPRAATRMGASGLGAKFARGALGILQEGPASKIALTPTSSESANVALRVHAIETIAHSFKLSDAAVANLRSLASNVKSEEDLFKLIEMPVRLAGRESGLPTEIVDQIVAGARRGTARSFAFGANQETGKLIENLQTLAQRVDVLVPPQASDLARAINEELARNGDLYAKMRAVITKGGDIGISLQRIRDGKRLTITLAAQMAHRLWKFFVVTNLQLPVFGALAGTVAAITGVSGVEDIPLYAAAGLAGPLRYVARVSGIEDRARFLLERGFKPQEWIPGVSKWYAERGLSPIERFTDYPAVHAGGFSGKSELESRALLGGDRDWRALKVNQKGGMDAWERTITHQIQPDAYSVDKIFLAVKAEKITRAEADVLLAELRTTDEGKLWLARMAGGKGGPSTWKKATSSTENFINTYVTSKGLAEARLSGGDVRAAMKDAEPPAFVHAQKLGRVTASNLYRSYREISSSSVLSGATNFTSRNPLARFTYRDEFDFQTRVLGRTAAEAHDSATLIAIEKTNSIFFRLDAASRFARKADYIFPFQQPREQFIRVWSKLIADNPARAFRIGHLAALALNNGEEEGLFRQDPLHPGNYILSIPGSGYLSQALFGLNTRFDINLKDMFFFSAGGAFGPTALPTPGGPFWETISRQLVNEFPQFFEKDTIFTKWLMPYGPGGDLMRPEARRLWMGITGSPAPWSFLDPNHMEGEVQKYSVEVARSMYANNLAALKKANGGAITPEQARTAWPTNEEVKSNTMDFFKLWAFMGSVSPAVTRPIFTSAEQYQSVRAKLTLNNTIPLDYGKFTKAYPEYVPYLLPNSQYVGPDDLQHWDQPLSHLKEFELQYRESVTLNDFKHTFMQYISEQKAYTERQSIFNMPPGWDRDASLLKWSQANPKLASRSRETYFRDRDLAKIDALYPKGAMRDNALNRWRQQYSVSLASLPTYMDKAKKFTPNPWREARDTAHVVNDIQKALRTGMPEDKAVADLNPAEQHRYWDYKQYELNLDWHATDDPKAVLAQWNFYRDRKNDVLKAYPLLTAVFPEKNAFAQQMQDAKNLNASDIAAITAEIDTTTTAMDAAVAGKRWSEYYALKNKQQTLYDMKGAVLNDLYQKYPDLSKVYDDVAASSVAMKAGNIQEWQRLQAKLAGDQSIASTTFVPTNEEAYYLSLGPNVQKAYIANTQWRLNAASSEGASSQLKQELKDEKISKLYWSNLTDFMQQLLTNNLNQDQVRQWVLEDYTTFNPGKQKDLAAYARYGINPGSDQFGGVDSLQRAYALMKQYDNRGGVNAPRTYGEYLALPDNPLVRAEWLKHHPDVVGYLEAGGFLQMPDSDRMFVQDVLARYAPSSNVSGAGGGGNSNGSKSSRPLDVQFAYEQLARWTQRAKGAIAPDTYNTWVNMPTGVDKAHYLEAHPEIGDWLKLGPMANMPQEYQDIVRDIMTRYGIWTSESDPLGDTINGYYKTPAYARQQYLEQHPELLAYWAATQSPEEKVQHNLADQYFSLQDQTAKHAFLRVHPELQQYFLDQRNRRYTKFLNQVAIYLGQDPSLFEGYLQRQETILNEMLRRFGEPPLMRETFTSPKPGGVSRARDTGSQKANTRPRAA